MSPLRSRSAGMRSAVTDTRRSEEHTSELQSQSNLVCRLLLEKKKTRTHTYDRHTAFNITQEAKHTLSESAAMFWERALDTAMTRAISVMTISGCSPLTRTSNT